MRPDLLHAQASIDWAVAQLPSFQKRIDTWIEHNIEADIVDFDPTSPKCFIAAVEKEPLPLSFIVEAGAYINVIRSSLDILAAVLAERFSIGNSKDIYFPVAPSEKVFFSGGYKGAELVKGLPATERGTLESLKPYEGGNEPLWSLHQLDIMRKHRRLLSVIHIPQRIMFSGFSGHIGFAFEPIAAPMAADDKTIIGFIPRHTAKRDLKMTTYVAFDESVVRIRKPIITVLSEFASLANTIIKLFDSP